MKILICPDKFKGSLTATEVCQALAKGLHQGYAEVEVIQCPLADGGDGSLDVLARYLNLETVMLEASDPLGRVIQAEYRYSKGTAYVELAAASGLVLLTPQERNCMVTTSYGTGQLIADAIKRGANEIFLFIGGSATNDGGIGIAEALGYRFYDGDGNRLHPIGQNLVLIDRIENKELVFSLEKIKFNVVCDVDNPLYGTNGAAYVYGPQKGATPEEVSWLDQGLRNLAQSLKKKGYADISHLPGAGAAGGIGGGMVAFFNAQIRSGTSIFLEISNLEAHIQHADLIITGEGRMDEQTVQGKLISGVCKLAHQLGKPVIGVCGASQPGIGEALGMQRVYTVLERAASVSEAMELAAEKLIEIGKEIQTQSKKNPTFKDTK